MADRSFLNWPFFEDGHRALAGALETWCGANLPVDHTDVDAACVDLVRKLGAGGWLQHSAAAHADGLDVRTLCIIRETLARHDSLADFAFAMQGLGMGAVSLFGSPEQRVWLQKTRSGRAISAFALTEPGSGSDVAATSTTAIRVAGGYRLNGEKTYISNGGIADIYVLFARTGEAPGAKGLSAFLVPAVTPGLEIVERIEVMAPHPLARLKLVDAVLPDAALIGRSGDGFKIAMSTLDVFRATVGAAALGLARRAFDETLARVRRRAIGGKPLADLQMVQGHLADMALDIDAAALLIYCAAWLKDRGAARISREAAMAKLHATEAAQRVIDMAVQLHGGDGVRRGMAVEHLYRDIRALRIYEGASDVQRLVISRNLLAEQSLATEDPMPSPHEFLHPKSWKSPKGYANGVAASGRTIFCAGLIGWNADGVFETGEFAGQVEQALRNIVAVLAEAGARPEHLVRLTWYVTDKREYLASLPAIGRAYRTHIGRHFPAMTLVQVAGLVEEGAKVEIEATAVIPQG